ncbi:hypothetical protein INT45_006385 [Circinella minor]|uniref:Transcriptional coactivator p15 (PC4) C-terminal domain-containing protein n=1 Tax=Circinella minor TaxID=1195481 RepID=A0A8H7SF72_9FUNG|nr:hypothetical protein INT45_006385 [Circinella minor]
MGSSDEDEYKQTETKLDASSDEEFVEEEPKSKKQKVIGEKRKRTESSSSSGNDDNNSFELSSKRRIFVKTFANGQPSVDIRAIYNDKETGEMRYAKQGILLPLAQWEKLKELIPEIDEAIKNIKK